jgi:hypothetical protein
MIRGQIGHMRVRCPRVTGSHSGWSLQVIFFHALKVFHQPPAHLQQVVLDEVQISFSQEKSPPFAMIGR